MSRPLEKTFGKWMGALLKTKQTFQNERKNANLLEGFKYILFAAIVDSVFLYAHINAVWDDFETEIVSLVQETGLSIEINEAFASKLVLLNTPLILVTWLTLSLFLVLSAKLVGGKGNFIIQSYLLSLFIAPLIIINGAANLVTLRYDTANFLINILFVLFALYLLVLALKETHEYSTIRAISTLVIALIISGALFAVLVILVTTAYFLLG